MRALGWLFFACGYRNQTFRPGPDGAREGDFAQGMRHVAIQIYALLEAPVRMSGNDEQGVK